MPVVGGPEHRERPTNSADSHAAPRAAQPGDQPEHRPGANHVPPEALWDVHQVAAYLHIPVSSIYKMTARQPLVRIPHIRIGGKLRFRRADIDRWLELLTTSTIPALTKLRQKISQEFTHGDDP